MLERLGRRDVRARLRHDIARDGLTNFGRIPSWDVVRVAVSPHLPEHTGCTLSDIARTRAVDAFDAVCDFVPEGCPTVLEVLHGKGHERSFRLTRFPSWGTLGITIPFGPRLAFSPSAAGLG